MKKKIVIILSIVLVIAIVCWMLYCINYGGECGYNAFYLYNPITKTLTVSGEGYMYPFEENKAPWCDEYIDKVIINEGITYISTYAFANMGIEELSLPESLEIVGDYAFYSNHITEIIIPENVTYIGQHAF